MLGFVTWISRFGRVMPRDLDTSPCVELSADLDVTISPGSAKMFGTFFYL